MPSSSAAPRQSFAAPSAQTLSDLSNCRILLAEDGLDNQRLVAHILRLAGAEVAVAENGQEAFERVQSAAGLPFDAILMDMQMPVMDGYEATRRLRKAGYRGPILALTAHAMADDEKKCLDAGCNGYIAKPINRQWLLSEIARSVARGSQPAGAPSHAE